MSDESPVEFMLGFKTYLQQTFYPAWQMMRFKYDTAVTAKREYHHGPDGYIALVDLAALGIVDAIRTRLSTMLGSRKRVEEESFQTWRQILFEIIPAALSSADTCAIPA